MTIDNDRLFSTDDPNEMKRILEELKASDDADMIQDVLDKINEKAKDLEADSFDAHMVNAIHAVKTIIENDDMDLKGSYDLWLSQTNKKGITLAKGLDLWIFANVNTLNDRIDALERQIHKMDMQLASIKKNKSKEE